MKKIKYIGFYTNDFETNRVFAKAAVSKMDYIISVLNELDYKVEIISPSWLQKSNKKIELYYSKKESFGKNEIIYGAVFYLSFFKYFQIIFSWFWLFFYLIFNVKKNEKIIVYHSNWLTIPILFAKKIKQFHLILEVEEIYKDVMNVSNILDSYESKMFNKANSFLFSTELLAQKLAKDKPFTIVYGDYRIVNNGLNNEKLKDNKIKLVYAGIVDEVKAGAFNAIALAPYLNDNYEIHIAGFGDIDKLKTVINKNNTLYTCKAYYDGNFSGDAYFNYLKQFDIALSTQNIDGSYTNSSFPSKILVYLSFGMPVISGYMDCIVKSEINDLVFYYFKNDPKEIAEVILKNIGINKTRIFEKLYELHINFKNNLENQLQ